MKASVKISPQIQNCTSLLLENYLLILLSNSKLYESLSRWWLLLSPRHIVELREHCVWAVEVMPLVLIVAIGDDFCGKSLENSNSYVGKVLLKH